MEKCFLSGYANSIYEDGKTIIWLTMLWSPAKRQQKLSVATDQIEIYQFTASFRALPGLKATVLLALIWMVSPV